MSGIPARLRSRAGALVVVVALLTAGVTLWWPTGASAAGALRRAALQTASQGGATVVFDAGVSGAAGAKQASGSGTVDFASGAAQLTFAASEAFPGGADVRVVGASAYVSAPGILGGLLGPDVEWVSIPLDAGAVRAPDAVTTTVPTQATDAVGRLGEVGLRVADTGRFVVGDVTTTAYRFEDPDATATFAGVAYVDEAGLVRRLELDTAEAAAGSSGSLRMDLTTFSTPPPIDTPPADRTVDLAHVLAPVSGGEG